jgi:hypothetical protein
VLIQWSGSPTSMATGRTSTFFAKSFQEHLLGDKKIYK